MAVREKKDTKVIVSKDVVIDAYLVRNSKGNKVRKDRELKAGEYKIMDQVTTRAYDHYDCTYYYVIQDETGYKYMIKCADCGIFANDKTFKAI